MHSFKIESTATQMLAQARCDTGIDIADDDIEETLERLLHSLNTEAELSAEGAAAMTQRLMHVLCNRLRMHRDFARDPEIAAQAITKPLIFCGGGRTGSTKLHKLLAASGDFLYLPFWRGYCLGLRSGERAENPAPRIREADEHTRWFDRHAPLARLIHAYETFEAEEETLLLEHRFCGMFMMAFAFIPGYVQWSMPFFREDLAFMKRCMQYLQWQFHEGDRRPWVLKCPIHFGNELLLRQVFPDATLVTTHRDPLETLSSTASLLEHYHQAYSNGSRKPTYGAMMLEGTAMGAESHMLSRDANPGLNILDVGYPDIIRNVELVLERIYAHAGLEFSEQAREATRNWERQNAQHRHGVHQHSLEEFGLSAEQAAARLRPYRDRFAHLMR